MSVLSHKCKQCKEYMNTNITIVTETDYNWWIHLMPIFKSYLILLLHPRSIVGVYQCYSNAGDW